MYPRLGFESRVIPVESFWKTSAAVHEPEAPAWAPFGQYAWASRREGLPEEPDTEVEKEVFEDLRAHFASSRTGLPASTASLLTTFVLLGWYAPVLHPPPQEVLYRGIKLRGREHVINLLGGDVEELPDTGRKEFPEGIVVPSVNGHSTSWTARKHITKDFSEKGKAGWSVTLVASVGANAGKFLAGPGGLYNVQGMSRWHLEKETVGLEPIRILRVEWSKL